MTEEQLGKLMARYEKQNGHRSKLPGATGGQEQHPLYHQMLGWKRHGATHADIAKRAGLSRSRVTQIVGGKS